MLRGQVKIVAITGAAGSGKSRLSQALQGQFGYTPMSFSAGLKKMIYTLPEMQEANFVDRDWKERIHPLYGKSPREMMQTLGTEWGRNLIHPDIWVKISAARVEAKWLMNKALDCFVFDDLRFESEATWVRSLNGLVVHVDRFDNPHCVRAHESENGVDFNMQCDMRITNNRTVEDFVQKASKVHEHAEGLRIAASAE